MSKVFDYMTNTETVEVPSSQFNQTVATCQIQGWKLVSNDGYEAMLRWAGSSGSLVNHVIVGLLTLPTMGMGNLVYAGTKKGSTTKRLRIIAVDIQPEVNRFERVDRYEREQVTQTPITEFIDMETGKEFKVSADKSKWEQVTQTQITESMDIESNKEFKISEKKEFKISEDRSKIPFANEISELRRNWRQKP